MRVDITMPGAINRLADYGVVIVVDVSGDCSRSLQFNAATAFDPVEKRLRIYREA